MVKEIVKRNGAGLLFFSVCLYLLYIDILEGYWDHDSGFYFLQSLLITKGFKPFVDFSTLYPPGFALLNAIPIFLGLPSYFISWFMPLLWAAVIGLLTLRCWKLTNPSQPTFSGWFFAGLFPLYCIDFGGNHNTLELGVALFGLLAIAEFLRGNSRRFFWVGFYVGCALLVKQVGVLLIFPFITQCGNKKHLGQLVGGFFLPALLCLSWLRFDFEKIKLSMESLQKYVSASSPGDLSSWLQSAYFLIFSEILRTPPGFFLILGIFALALLTLDMHISSKSTSQSLWVGSWILVGAAYLSARLINNYPHYTVNCWPVWVALLLSTAGYIRPVLRNVVIASAFVGSVTVFFFAGVPVRDMQEKPYFSRWTGENLLGAFLLPVSQEMNLLIPPGATITQLGPEESILLFLMDRVPLNKDWVGYYLRYPVYGDAVVFVDYGQSDAPEQRTQILESGHTLKKQWELGGETISLYLRPVR